MNEQIPVIIAACGDVHGRMHQMQEQLLQVEQCSGLKIDLVLQVGDFQPIMNEQELASLKVPSKYRSMGDFSDYARGNSSFLWPIWFIGGNHEPVALLDQYPDGAELVSNCHYLGRVGQVQWQGLTIAGLSGIYHVDSPPARGCVRSEKTLTTAGARTFSFGEQEIDRLISMPSPDILLLHDWPAGIVAEPAQGMERSRDRGCQVCRTVVELLQPKLVLCGHQHVSWQTSITMGSGRTIQVCCLDQVDPAKPGCLALFQYLPGKGIEQVDRYTGMVNRSY